MMNRMLDIPCVPIFSVPRPENVIRHHCFSNFFQTKDAFKVNWPKWF